MTVSTLKAFLEGCQVLVSISEKGQSERVLYKLDKDIPTLSVGDQTIDFIDLINCGSLRKVSKPGPIEMEFKGYFGGFDSETTIEDIYALFFGNVGYYADATATNYHYYMTTKRTPPKELRVTVIFTTDETETGPTTTLASGETHLRMSFAECGIESAPWDYSDWTLSTTFRLKTSWTDDKSKFNGLIQSNFSDTTQGLPALQAYTTTNKFDADVYGDEYG